jgi:hypothetical protein
MNFYQLYNLINENTVSQELKKLKKENPSTIEKFLPVAYEQTKHFLPNVNDKSLKTIANWILFLYFHFCKQNQIYNASLVTFNQYLTNNLTLYVHGDYLASQLDNNGNWNAILSSKFNDPKFALYDLANLDRDYHENLKKKQRNIPGAEGKTIIEFPDGYKWVNLERGYCAQEGESMGHCGNTRPKPGDTILSLRDSKNFPHLTFILNNGVLGQRKAKANEKPAPKYYPYIIELLKLPIIKDLKKGEYKPETDFKLSDLNKKEIEELLKVKPEMKMAYYKHKVLSREHTHSNITQDIIHKDIPVNILIELSDDEDFEVRQAVAMNKHTPIETIIKLNNDKHPSVIRGVCLNPSTPPEILLNHSEFSDILSCVSLISNPSLPQKGLFNIFNRFKDDMEKNTDKPGELSNILFSRFQRLTDLPKEIKEKLDNIK